MKTTNYTLALFDALNSNRIKYCVLRNYKYLPHCTGDSDLDILVAEHHLEAFFDQLRAFIASNQLKLVSCIADKDCPKFCIVNESWGIQIDVFKGSVKYAGREMISSEIIFNNAEVCNGVTVLNPNLGSLLSFLKELLNNKKCSDKYIVDLQSKFKSSKIDGVFLAQFCNIFTVNLNSDLHNLNSKTILELYKLSRLSFKKTRCYGSFYKLKRLFQPPGYTIVFLGTDGSGKSTIIEAIKPTLNKAFHNAVHYEHLRPNYFPSIAQIFGRKENRIGPATDPHGSSASGFFGSLIRWSYYMLDYILGYYLKIWFTKTFRSCVWLFDRYYYDYLIDPKRSRVKLPKWILRLGQIVIPEPDLIVCLGTDPQIIHSRKPELPLLEIERQVNALKAFSQQNKRAVWIDTAQSIEESSHEAMKAIIKVMAMRFKSVRIS